MIQSRGLIFWGVLSLLLQDGNQQEPELTSIRYFVSTDALTWNEAKDDCDVLFRGNGSLLSIKSEKEFKDHKTIFELQGEALVGSYWTAGKFDSASNDFIWDGSGDIVPDGKGWSESPWKKEVPDSQTDTSRVFLEHTNTPETYLSFADETEKKKYICEDKLQTSGKCIRWTDYMDVVFALDASYSMRDSSKFCGMFMKKMVLANEPSTSYRYAFFVFGSKVKDFTWSFHLSENLTREEIDEKIKKSSKDAKNSGNDYGLAIQAATQELLDNPRPGVVSRNIILFTDGEFEPDLPNPMGAAKKATDEGINIFVMRIVDDEEYTEGRTDTKDNAINMAGGHRERVFSLHQKKDELIQEQTRAKIFETICRT